MWRVASHYTFNPPGPCRWRVFHLENLTWQSASPARAAAVIDMPKSPKVSFGRTRGPKGSNELINPPDPIQMGEWEDFPGIEPVGSTPGVKRGVISTRNRRSRRISGPKNSRINELEYKGT